MHTIVIEKLFIDTIPIFFFFYIVLPELQIRNFYNICMYNAHGVEVGSCGEHEI